MTINELAQKIIALSGKDIEIEHDLSKPTGTDKYACDMTSMKAELGWEPTTPLEEGLQKVYRWAETELDTTPMVSADGGGST